MIYKRNCLYCNKYYEGFGKKYCSRKCWRLAISLKPAQNFKDITGKRFGKLVAIRTIGKKRGAYLWLCKCDCGNTTEVTSSKLNRNRSCGCMVKEKRRKKGEWKPSKETRKKMSETNLKNPRRYWLGKKRPSPSLKTRKKMSRVHIKRREFHPNWKGGKTAKLTALRHSLEYKLWREAVFERDNYTCQLCGQRGGKLNADHIKMFAYFPEFRFRISNGRTLCESCHKLTDTYLAKGQYKELEIGGVVI